MDDELTIGNLLGPWGVKGWVRVFSHADPPEGIFDYDTWLIGRERRPCRVLQWRRMGPRLVAALEGVTPREEAEALGELPIRIRRDQLPETEPGQYYWRDLLGLTVTNRAGRDLGEVEGMMSTGAHDILVVAGPVRHLIPFVHDRFIDEVDLDAGRIRVDWEPEWSE